MRRNKPKKIFSGAGGEVLVRFGWSLGGKGRQVKAVKVKSEGGRVRSSGVECISKIHEEGVAAPAEAILDERVGNLAQ